MGFFDQTTQLEKQLRNINSQVYYEILPEDVNKYIPLFGEELLTKIIGKVGFTNPEYKETFEGRLKEISEIYQVIVEEPENLLLENTFNNLLELYLKNSIIVNKDNILKAANSFDNKTLVLEFFRFLINNENILDEPNEKNISLLIGYLEEARQYYVDDRALFSSVISLINGIDPAKIKYGTEKTIKTIISKKLTLDKKANGIYDIDESTLKEMDRKIEQLGLLSERINTLMQTAEKQMKDLSGITDEHRRVLTETRINELKQLNEEADRIIKNFNASYLELLGQEKSSILQEKQLLLAELDKEIQQRKTILDNYIDRISQNAAIELRRISLATGDSLRKIEEFLSDNEKVKQFLGEAGANTDFLKQIKELESILANPTLQGVKVAGTGSLSIGVQPVITSEVTQLSNSNQSVLDGLSMPAIIIPKEENLNVTPVNYFFDKRISYRQRFEQLMELKQKHIIEKGEIYHERFDDILTMCLQNDAPYMYGPSGCGKTYMIQKQLAKLLGLNVITNGYVLYEQDILGYTNSGTGAYVPSNFYRAYKYGHIIFFDELDNGIANATTVLNSFLTGDDTDTYVFPNGETVQRHSNFRIVSAGNTKGSGKTLAHNTRQKMDESVMQRLTPVEVGYDNRIEEMILSDYPDWFDFAVNFRKAIESIPSEGGHGVNSIGTFTTRDAQSVKKYKDDAAMNDEQLIDYEIIENKDIDYLNQIKRKMEEYESRGEITEGKQLLRIFSQKVYQRGN